MDLNTKVSHLNRVGKTVEKQLKKLNIETARDLLFYYPFRYEDYSKTIPISDLKDGEQVTIKAQIELLENRRAYRRRSIITEAIVSDDTGQLRVVWFGQPFITKNLRVGETIHLSGKVTKGKLGLQMTSPSYERENISGTHTGRIVPMYPLTSGITQKQLRFLVSQVISLAGEVKDWLPEDILEKADIMGLAEAIGIIHFPENEEEIKHARRRLKFDELFILQLRAEMIRQSLRRQKSSPINFQEENTKKFVASLHFKLTKDQKIVAWEILQDLAKDKPMNRLLQGDVGSGKTVVAALTMYNSALNNFQSSLMAPTEVLSIQHYKSLSNLLKNTNIKICLYTRSKAELNCKSNIADYETLKKKKNFIAKEIKKGKLDIIVGTHALLTENVGFKNLGFVIVDEQQRFGVEQRKTIREKSGNDNTMPHFLSMTATPIPRSFALTIYGDLDMSIIREMPPGRKIIKTRLVEAHNRGKAYDFIRAQIKFGRQAFVICPLIEDVSMNNEPQHFGLDPELASGQLTMNKNLDKKTVMSEYEKLSKTIFPNLKIGYLHGKLKPEEKEETMNKFSKKELDILISTSVIEVGVDVPNASVMMIEGAERFGLAQLHQFRGRVGRSEYQSYCFLFTDSETQKARDRLSFFEKNNDGFELAKFDLSQRGPGEVYGKLQSGMLNFRFASMRDIDLIKKARDLARALDFEKYKSLKDKVKEWEYEVHLE